MPEYPLEFGVEFPFELLGMAKLPGPCQSLFNAPAELVVLRNIVRAGPLPIPKPALQLPLQVDMPIGIAYASVEEVRGITYVLEEKGQGAAVYFNDGHVQVCGMGTESLIEHRVV